MENSTENRQNQHPISPFGLAFEPNCTFEKRLEVLRRIFLGGSFTTDELLNDFPYIEEWLVKDTIKSAKDLGWLRLVNSRVIYEVIDTKKDYSCRGKNKHTYERVLDYVLTLKRFYVQEICDKFPDIEEDQIRNVLRKAVKLGKVKNVHLRDCGLFIVEAEIVPITEIDGRELKTVYNFKKKSLNQLFEFVLRKKGEFSLRNLLSAFPNESYGSIVYFLRLMKENGIIKQIETVSTEYSYIAKRKAKLKRLTFLKEKENEILDYMYNQRTFSSREIYEQFPKRSLQVQYVLAKAKNTNCIVRIDRGRYTYNTTNRPKLDMDNLCDYILSQVDEPFTIEQLSERFEDIDIEEIADLVKMLKDESLLIERTHSSHNYVTTLKYVIVKK